MKLLLNLCLIVCAILGILLAGCNGQTSNTKAVKSDPAAKQKMAELGLTPKKSFNNGDE